MLKLNKSLIRIIYKLIEVYILKNGKNIIRLDKQMAIYMKGMSIID